MKRENICNLGGSRKEEKARLYENKKLGAEGVLFVNIYRESNFVKLLEIKNQSDVR